MSGSSAHVLVADPDRLQLQLIDMLLGGDGFELTLVDSGREALEHLRETTPDLCLLALDLPDVTGDDICGKIRRVSRLAKTPVVLIAPQEGRFGLSDDARRRARRAGADLILPRPLGDKNLRERVQAVLDDRDATPDREGYSTAVIETALDEIDDAVAAPPLGRPRIGRGTGVANDDAKNDANESAVAERAGAERAGAEQAGADRAGAAQSSAEPLAEEPDASAAHAGPWDASESQADPAGDGTPTYEPSVGATISEARTDANANGDANAHADTGNAASGTPATPNDPERTAPGHAHPSPPEDLGRMRKELEILRVENAQLKRKLKEKQDQLAQGVNPELERKIDELERRNAALLSEIEKHEGSNRGGGLFGRRRER